jgi:hypothetical protein
MGYDTYVRAWLISDLSLSKSVQIASPYLIGIAPFNNKFLVGIGNGNIVQLSDKFEIGKEIQVHEDCITGIMILPNYVITSSYDGNICFLNQSNFGIEKYVEIGTPIHQCLLFESHLYIASNPSYKVDL